MKKKTKTIIGIVVVLFLLFILIGFVLVYINSSLKPTKEFLNGQICEDSIPCEVTLFTVEEGSYGKETLQNLQDKGIIKDANIVYYWNKIFGGYSFYAGNYLIPHKINNDDISLDQLLSYLSDASNAKQDTVIIKLDEGDFAKSFARSIAENINLSDIGSDDVDYLTEMIISYWNDEYYIRDLMVDYPFLTDEMINENCKILLEGYLFPDTYEFFEFSTIDEVTRKILDNTLNIYNKYIDGFNSSNLSIHEIFTLASIVQWETGDPEDSKIVAGAFLNRINDPEFEYTGGKLQSTVTACYAFDLSKDECNEYGDSSAYTQEYNEYNTYTIEGLPPGPVCCPNENAIYAALYPNQEAGYYFFVANMCDGGTAFATTYDEHENNINRYYLPCAN